jgi:hypothetical protein
MYLGPCCPGHPFSEELDDTEINTQIHEVLTHGAVLNLGTGHIPRRDVVDNPMVSLLRPTFGYLHQFWFLNVCVFLRRVSGVFVAPRRGVTLHEDAVSKEAHLACRYLQRAGGDHSRCVLAEMAPGRDWTIELLTTAAPSHVGIF